MHIRVSILKVIMPWSLIWMNVNGPLPGGGGSTELAAAGIGTSGDHVQVADDASDGAWFLVTGEGGLPGFQVLSGQRLPHG